jgi:hypothetical protein
VRKKLSSAAPLVLRISNEFYELMKTSYSIGIGPKEASFIET